MVQRVALPAGYAARLAAVASASALYGAITVGARYFTNAGLSLFEIALAGSFFGSLMVAPALIARSEYRIKRRDTVLFVAYGIVGAVLQVSQFLGVVLGVPLAVVALLLYTQPVWTVVLGRIMLGEAITLRRVAALIVAGAGVVILVEPRGAMHGYSTVGLIAGLIAGMCISLWVILGRISSLRGNHPIASTMGYQLSTAATLLLAWPLLLRYADFGDLMRLDFGNYARTWPAVLGFSLFVNILPAVLMMWGMRRVPAASAGVLLLLEPVAGGFMAWLFFSEPITGSIWLGGALILASNAIQFVGGERA